MSSIQALQRTAATVDGLPGLGVAAVAAAAELGRSAREARTVEHWTVVEPSDGQFRRHINYGGKPYWCMFDFTVLPGRFSGAVEVELTHEANLTTVEWFPHVRQGMLRGLEFSREHGREWSGVRIEVRKVYAHPIDTTVHACEEYGFAFVLDELPTRGVRLPVEGRAEQGAAADRGNRD